MRILLLGASGYVGGALWSEWSARHTVVGTCASRPVPGLVPLDLRDQEALRRLLDQGFDLVVHAAGLVDLSDAERQPELARQLNAASVATLRDAVRGTGTRILLLSTDNVFDGTADTYTEGDERAPVNAYGHSKRAAEDALIGADALVGEDTLVGEDAFAGADAPAGTDSRLAGGHLVDGHLVVRIPLVYGRSPIADRFMARFDGPRTPARTDLVCAPVYLPWLPGALEELWDRSGLLHLGGAQVVTRYELMTRIRDALALPTEVVPVSGDDPLPAPRRPARLVLRSVHHGLLGPGLDTALGDMVRGGPAGRP
ncbi:sugar nucleotide-binding protein [Streptomyces malaysiensis subsp. malaysiensis]|uniref:dTDP-4-dehydrorhamnose reductase n=1 Tax=Streptomyces malaysiensis TaxID=92644 RepID=A0ABX6WAB8_STRMQ|nr:MULTISPECIES: sugar nucleotide-binding protein [Streptomyces]QPI58374.1 sugar nucleotide-binding protein [Streptomyces solisilvae]UHH19968.1 sugar nucleotide-binding protein [Streptomyces sp. HNM0561]